MTGELLFFVDDVLDEIVNTDRFTAAVMLLL